MFDVDRHATPRTPVRPRRSRVCLGENCSAAERDHGRPARERFGDDLLLDPAELGLAAFEELADRAEMLLDLLVGVDERTVHEPRELAAERRLPRAHEADEREVLVYRADHGMRSR